MNPTLIKTQVVDDQVIAGSSVGPTGPKAVETGCKIMGWPKDIVFYGCVSTRPTGNALDHPAPTKDSIVSDGDVVPAHQVDPWVGRLRHIRIQEKIIAKQDVMAFYVLIRHILQEKSIGIT